MEKQDKNSVLTTIGIDQHTNKLIEKLCKRYSQLEKNQEKYNAVLQRVSGQINQYANVINNQGKQIGLLQQIQKKDSTKILKLISLYADLAANCGVMDSKRKENLKSEIIDLISE